ncbi:Mlp lipoprotein family protein [Borreliella japonica]|uniref:Mlp lipoprotein family protein n=1 Tax=Borreliella japonica TaxID=34095 RepID=A0A1G4QI08_BORJA|nr:Mlp family lipoprotein [Borreliella japonica]SCW44283.1 Mlp lipoprotein family protein [Borreliella japonica]
MKIINVLFCLFLLILNSCNANDNDTFKNKNKPIEPQQAKNKEKYDLGQKEVQKELLKKPQQEIPKSRENLLKEKLTDDQKIHLDWLKTALTGEGEFDRFLQHDENKIKDALNHIKSELESCTGDQADQGKNTFKETVKGFFSGGDINDFTNQATINCNN